MYPSESFFFVPKLEDRVLKDNEPIPTLIDGITLSASAIKVSCSAINSSANKNCSNDSRIISVSTAINESDNNLSIYYTVSAGKIIGTGKDVMWDLSDVKPGKYTITAGVDDGCGICGEQTKTVEERMFR